MNTTQSTYFQYTMITSKLGVQHGTLAVKDTKSALRTFKGLAAAGIVDQAAVFAPGEEGIKPLVVFG
jgi:hypothetical protein